MGDSALKTRVVRASVIELIGFAGTQVLRLASTLILSRLLFPEAFGLSALLTILTYGLVMLSDVGLLQSVVQNERGDDPRFLNTVWTLQALRGVALWVLACLFAWPMSVIYAEPELLSLIPVGASSVMIRGFASTSLYTLRRRVAVGTLVRLELISQALGLAVIVAWAYWNPSVWAIVAGGLASAAFGTLASHFMAVGYRNRFEWDPSAKESILHFGKWIFASSALDFVGRQGDRILLAHFLGVATLGVYTIAMFLSDALGTAVNRISHGVLFPLLSQVGRDEPNKLREVYYKARLRMDLLGLLPTGAVMSLSQTVVDILYDPRYADAGWMLQALCVRVAMGIVLVPLQACLFSTGHTKYGFYQNGARTMWIAIGLPIAWSWWGVAGLVWVAAFSEIPAMVVLWRAFHRLGLLKLSREFLAAAIFALGLALGYAIDAAIHTLASHYSWVF